MELTENGNLRLFVANGKRNFVSLGQQTINGNHRLLFQKMCPSLPHFITFSPVGSHQPCSFTGGTPAPILYCCRFLKERSSNIFTPQLKKLSLSKNTLLVC